jgi:hypothetical protein
MDFSLISTVILGTIGICITYYYSWHTQKLSNEIMSKQLFTEFNNRYDKLNNFLIEIEKQYPTMDQLNKAPNAAELKKKVIDYFILCSEEFYWYHHKKRIDNIIWNSWHSGMNYWYNNVPAIKELWEQEVNTNSKASYYIIDNNEFFIKK